MPQISLYIDKDTLNKIQSAANKEKLSISKWVGKNLKKVVRDEYPEGYFALFGSINDDTFNSPDSLSFKADSRRKRL